MYKASNNGILLHKNILCSKFIETFGHPIDYILVCAKVPGPTFSWNNQGKLQIPTPVMSDYKNLSKSEKAPPQTHTPFTCFSWNQWFSSYMKEL